MSEVEKWKARYFILGDELHVSRQWKRRWKLVAKKRRRRMGYVAEEVAALKRERDEARAEVQRQVELVKTWQRQNVESAKALSELRRLAAAVIQAEDEHDALPDTSHDAVFASWAKVKQAKAALRAHLAEGEGEGGNG